MQTITVLKFFCFLGILSLTACASAPKPPPCDRVDEVAMLSFGFMLASESGGRIIPCNKPRQINPKIKI